MDCPLLIHPENGGELIDIHNAFKLAGIRRWWSGLPIPESKRVNIPNPIVITYDSLNGYTGLPQVMEDIGIPLMSRLLFDTLIKAGVDTLESFPAVLQNSETGEEFDYLVYNIAAKLSREDLSESSVLLARLEEDVSSIVVCESVRKMIEKSGIVGLAFLACE